MPKPPQEVPMSEAETAVLQLILTARALGAAKSTFEDKVAILELQRAAVRYAGFVIKGYITPP